MVELKRKVRLKRKIDFPNDKPKTKGWLWLLPAILLIVAVFFVINKFSSSSSNEMVTENVETATIITNEIAAEIQSGIVNFDGTQVKVAEAQKAVDEAKANAITDKEKQVVAEAQAKVDEARKAVDKVKSGESLAAAETSPVVSKDADAQGASEQPGSIPAISTEPKQPDTEKPATMPEQRDGSTTVKTDPSSTSAPTLPQGSLEEKAKRVIRGDFGNGSERKEALGSEYNVIQSKVNEMYRKGEVY